MKQFVPMLLLATAACTTTGEYHAPVLPSPPIWASANSQPAAQQADWWKSFNDPVLDGLVIKALADSPDIAQALARIDQSRAAAGMARASQFPVGNIDASAARQRQSTESGLGQVTRYVPSISRTQDQFSASASLGWDIDFAGGLAHSRAAAKADLAAVRAAAQMARITVASELVDAYLAHRAAQAQWVIAQSRRAAMAGSRAIMAARLAQGEISAQGDARAEAALAQMDASLPQTEAQLTLTRQRIALLTGQPASTLLPELDAKAAIPLAQDPAAGLPGDILRHRPDVVMAQSRLQAAHARIGTAQAEYWPHLSLTGLIGQQSGNLASLTGDSANVVQGAAGLRWRLFDFARVDAEVAGAKGRAAEALAAWRGAVLNAGAEVEGAFVTLAARRTAYAMATRQAEALNRARASASAAFAKGHISRDELATATIAKADGEAAQTAARLALAQALLQCHRALAQ